MTLVDFQNSWEKLVEKGYKDYLSLTSDERIWYNIQSLIGSLDNGGLISFYYNSYGERVYETIEDLKFLGFQDIANILIEINKLFPNENPSIDINERNIDISNWPNGKYELVLDNLDKLFYSKEEQLEQQLILHIKTKLQL